MKRILVQICCSVDSHYFLQLLRDEYPNSEIIGFFYNPNIHPYSEYILRYKDVQYSSKKLDIRVIDGEYELQKWLNQTKGYEKEPEKGDRCTICYETRLLKTILKAKELGCDGFTTTLLMSPLKSQEKLNTIGTKLSKEYNIEFIYKDYRSGKGGVEQNLCAKENRLYRQNYCGCLYALKSQREYQQRLCDELISPINRQVLPSSIEYRLELFTLRDKLIEDNKEFFIKKIEFMNYRLLQAYLKQNNQILKSYVLAYSYLKNQTLKAKIEYIKDDIAYLNKNGVVFIKLDRFNKILKTNYQNIGQIDKNPPRFDDEVALRRELIGQYSLSPIVVVEEFNQDQNYEIFIDSKYYIDTKEEIETFS